MTDHGGPRDLVGTTTHRSGDSQPQGDGSSSFLGNHPSRFSHFLSAHASSGHVGPPEALTAGPPRSGGNVATPPTGGPLPWNGSRDCSMLAGAHTGRTASGAPACDSVQTPGRAWRGTHALGSARQPHADHDRAPCVACRARGEALGDARAAGQPATRRQLGGGSGCPGAHVACGEGAWRGRKRRRAWAARCGVLGLREGPRWPLPG